MNELLKLTIEDVIEMGYIVDLTKHSFSNKKRAMEEYYDMIGEEGEYRYVDSDGLITSWVSSPEPGNQGVKVTHFIRDHIVEDTNKGE